MAEKRDIFGDRTEGSLDEKVNLNPFPYKMCNNISKHIQAILAIKKARLAFPINQEIFSQDRSEQFSMIYIANGVLSMKPEASQIVASLRIEAFTVRQVSKNICSTRSGRIGFNAH